MIRLAQSLLLSLTLGPAWADPPRVVTDLAVTEALASEVLGDLAQPDRLVDPGSDPHHFHLRPSQARALESAELLIWIGPALTPWLEDVARPDLPQLRLLEVDGVKAIGFDDHGHDHGADLHGNAAEDHEEGHDEEVDPHAWLDPHNAQAWLTVIAATLADLDPENATTYRRNAETAAARIADLHERLRARIEAADLAPIVVFHDAYGYFERAFGIEVSGSVALGDAAAPGARHLRSLERVMSEHGVECAFREPQHNPALAERIARDTGARLATLDPLGALVEPGPRFYDRLLGTMVEAIVACDAAAG